MLLNLFFFFVLLKIKVSVEPCLVSVVVLMRDCSGMGEYEAGKEKITVFSLQKTRLHHWLCYTLHERSFSKIHNRGTLKYLLVCSAEERKKNR